MKNPEMFVQDDYKMRPNLTINIGLRYDISHGWNEIHGNEMLFDPTVLNPATSPESMGALWFGTTKANGRASLQANVFSTFLPRLGFSWQPLANTTVRGGFGVYDHIMTLDDYSVGLGNALSATGNVSDTTSGIYANRAAGWNRHGLQHYHSKRPKLRNDAAGASLRVA